MNIVGRTAGSSKHGLAKQSSACLLSLALLFATWPLSLSAQDAPAQATPAQDTQGQDTQAPPQSGQAVPYAQQTPEQLQRLVAPIALYPDSLVAQILAASTFPEEVVEADRWVEAHPDLKGDALGQGVDQQAWDPSVKALAAFPSVLGNMDKNLSWTSSLGDAYYNQQQDVMDAVQVMRHKAQAAGALKTTQQEVVQEEGPDIDIEPAAPDVVYVPAYDPWLVYGYPIVAWPGWYPYPGIWFEVRTSRLESVLASVGSVVLDGDGVTGDLTGMTITQGLVAAGTTPGAERFTTVTVTTAEEASAA